MIQQQRSHALRYLAVCTVAFSLAVTPALSAQAPPPPPPTVAALHKGFLNPPNEARPMVRWWWFGLAVVKPEILRELQQMKADGIQGAELAFEYPQVLDDPSKDLKNLPFLSPEMLDDVTYAQTEGRKLGLRIDVTLCSGWPYGGPHITLANASTSLRTMEVPVAADVTSVAVPKLGEGESIVSAVIADPAKSAPPAPAPGRGGRGGGPRPATFDPASAKPLIVSGAAAAVDASGSPRVAVFFILSHTKQQVKRAAGGAEGYVLDSFSHEAVAAHIKAVGVPLLKAFGSTPPYAIFSD